MPDGKIAFTWKNFSDANITLTNAMKKELGAAAFAWAHAAYLLTVAPGSYVLRLVVPGQDRLHPVPVRLLRPRLVLVPGRLLPRPEQPHGQATRPVNHK